MQYLLHFEVLRVQVAEGRWPTTAVRTRLEIIGRRFMPNKHRAESSIVQMT